MCSLQNMNDLQLMTFSNKYIQTVYQIYIDQI